MNDRTLTDLLDEGIVNKDYNYTNGVKDEHVKPTIKVNVLIIILMVQVILIELIGLNQFNSIMVKKKVNI